ncbi:MAG: hypothetical protein HRU35_04165 [Rickettsiaceae bacterium]|nr:hypothetical protein [Rickettsiaceae bacterium]
MSFNVVNKFQLKLLEILANCSQIRKNNIRVYFSITQDSQYPFILVKMLQIENLSKFTLETYRLSFEICIFTRSRNLSQALAITDEIHQTLQVNNCHFDQYLVIGIKSPAVNFTDSNDLRVSKTSMNYQATVRKSKKL